VALDRDGWTTIYRDREWVVFSAPRARL
jgi:hypothetical protein